jgi:hypothetical protein
MSTQTSIGPDADRGGNEDHGNADGCGNKTLGDHATQQPPAGAAMLDDAEAQGAAGVPRPDPARGKLPKDG